MCSCISSSEVYDPDPPLSGGGQEQFLCVVVFNRLEKQITLTVAKSRCNRKVTLYNHVILPISTFVKRSVSLQDAVEGFQMC